MRWYMRCAIYARVSTSEQTSRTNFRNSGGMRRHEAGPSTEYVDRGVSGTKDRRPVPRRAGEGCEASAIRRPGGLAAGPSRAQSEAPRDAAGGRAGRRHRVRVAGRGHRLHDRRRSTTAPRSCGSGRVRAGANRRAGSGWPRPSSCLWEAPGPSRRQSGDRPTSCGRLTCPSATRRASSACRGPSCIGHRLSQKPLESAS